MTAAGYLLAVAGAVVLMPPVIAACRRLPAGQLIAVAGFSFLMSWSVWGWGVAFYLATCPRDMIPAPYRGRHRKRRREKK
jgi:hypothetical protein